MCWKFWRARRCCCGRRAAGGAYVVLVARKWDFVMEALLDVLEEEYGDED